MFASSKMFIGYFLFVVPCVLIYFYYACESLGIRFLSLPNCEYDYVRFISIGCHSMHCTGRVAPSLNMYGLLEQSLHWMIFTSSIANNDYWWHLQFLDTSCYLNKSYYIFPFVPFHQRFKYLFSSFHGFTIYQSMNCLPLEPQKFPQQRAEYHLVYINSVTISTHISLI
jgi:hypothetical protein